MKIAVQVFYIFAFIILPSCAGDWRGLDLSDEPEGFYRNLANEYKNLASYEENFMAHKDEALYFADKAHKVLKGEDVKPDELETRDIPEFAVEELSKTRSMLMDALETLRMDDNEALLAMAQTRYDCWLAMAEDFPVEDAYISCKTEFYNVLALLNIPEADNVVHSIYFESGAIALHKEARAIVEKIAVRYRGRPHWAIVLKGYTDSKGDKQQNRVLSMRRAIAVRNTLGQYGIDFNNISISAEGETGVRKKTAEIKREEHNSRRVDIRARPDYVAPNKEALTIIPGWQHL